MKKMRILVLVHEDLVPPESIEGLTEPQIAAFKAEFDVIATLREMGHEVRPLGVQYDVAPIRDAVQEFEPHIAFVLLEEFHGVGTYDHHIVSYLELLKQPYTGCNPRGLLLSHDKELAKKILTYHRIPTPRFAVIPRGRRAHRPQRLRLPLIVKSATEDASLGIAQASLARDDAALVERVQFVHNKLQSDALIEHFIEGRELYVGVMGNHRLQTFPVWEMDFQKMPEDVARIATAKVKWDPKYQKKHGIMTDRAKNLTPAEEQAIAKVCKRAYRALDMSGYARMDLRLTSGGKAYVLEANANPNIEYGEDFAESAEAVGIDYEQLLARIIRLGLNYRAEWQRYGG